MPTRLTQIDNRIEMATPENIGFDYVLAGPFARVPAYLVDLLIRVGVILGSFALFTFVFGSVGLAGLGIGMGLVIWFLVSWFYGGIFETFWNGQTPGKRMFGLRVVAFNGRPITAMQAVLRNVLRSIDSQPLTFYLVALIAAMFNDRMGRLGDVACGTMVVREDDRRLRGVARTREPQVLDLAARLSGRFIPGRSLARALAQYVQRRRYFTPARRAEIARHLGAPLVEQFGLPPETSHDLLLCALYHRTFVTDRAEMPADEPSAPATEAPRLDVPPTSFVGR